MNKIFGIILALFFFIISFIPFPREEEINNFISSIFLKISFHLTKNRNDASKYLVIQCPKATIPLNENEFSFMQPLVCELVRLDPGVIIFDSVLPVSKKSNVYFWMTSKNLQNKTVFVYPEQRLKFSIPIETEPDWFLANASFVINQKTNLEVVNFVRDNKNLPVGQKAVQIYDPKSAANIDSSIKYYFEDNAISRITLAEFLNKKLVDKALKGKIVLVKLGAYSSFDKPFLTPVGIMLPETLLFNDIESRLNFKNIPIIKPWLQKSLLFLFLVIILYLFMKLWLLQALLLSLGFLEVLIIVFWLVYFKYGIVLNYFKIGFSLFLFTCFLAVMEIIKLKKESGAVKELQTLKTILILQNKALFSMKKLSDLGRLSSGIYHEISNPLHNIYNALKTVYSDQNISSESHEMLDIAIQEIMRLQKLSSGLKQFFKPLREDNKEININEVLEFSLKLLSSTLTTKGISIIKKFSTVPPLIIADSSKLQQVFLNLFLNAIDAIVKDGKIFVETNILEKKIIIKINDTGSGITDDIRGDIFKEFFTTKTQTGSGLGLYISYEIINNLGGDIDISPYEQDKGAEFIIQLPLC